MPILASKYDYDVFFSYAWATDTGDQALRDWSRKVADGIGTLLRLRFNSEDELGVYLDRDKSVSAEELSPTLEKAATSSAIFVVLVSSYYTSDYCQREMNWFCDQLEKSGDAIADRVCLLRVQEPRPGKWPARFRNAQGGPLTYLDLCDNKGQPLNVSNFLFNGALPDLAQPVANAALEIADKLTRLRDKLRAREAYMNSRQRPDQPVIFFEAEAQDHERWSVIASDLREAPSIVLPTGNPKPATLAKAADYRGCDGIVMLRSRQQDELGERVKSAYLHRRTLYRSEKLEVPWALLDELDEPSPESENFSIPRVRAVGDWLTTLRRVLSQP